MQITITLSPIQEKALQHAFDVRDPGPAMSLVYPAPAVMPQKQDLTLEQYFQLRVEQAVLSGMVAALKSEAANRLEQADDAVQSTVLQALGVTGGK